jgi:hypothetical protein
MSEEEIIKKIMDVLSNIYAFLDDKDGEVNISEAKKSVIYLQGFINGIQTKIQNKPKIEITSSGNPPTGTL